MATAENLNEQQHVDRRNSETELKFTSRRRWSIATAIIAAIACIALFFAGRWALSVSSLFLSMIALSSFFTANGHLHHVQNRGKIQRRLSRDFSKLERDEAASADGSSKAQNAT